MRRQTFNIKTIDDQILTAEGYEYNNKNHCFIICKGEKHWHVYEFNTGLRVTHIAFENIKWAKAYIDTALKYFEDNFTKAVLKYEHINKGE